MTSQRHPVTGVAMTRVCPICNEEKDRWKGFAQTSKECRACVFQKNAAAKAARAAFAANPYHFADDGTPVTRVCRQCGQHRHIELDYRPKSRICRSCARKDSVNATRERRRKNRCARVPSGELRRCVVCKDQQDAEVSFRDNRNTCRSCEQNKNTRKRASQRVLAHRQAEQAGTVMPSKSVPHPGPFEITMARLVRQWGPYRTWTRHQHALHTHEIRKMTGLPELPEVELEAARLADLDRTTPRQGHRRAA